MQLRWLSRSWLFVTPENFAAMLTGAEKVTKDSLLLCFDDGFLSNRLVAERVLNKMGIKALFFVPSEFVALSAESDWQSFIAQNIYPSMKPIDVPDDWKNMNWEDLNYLIETGHTIGAHTARHGLLSQLKDDDLNREIIDSANVLEGELGIKINHFAYSFGNLTSFSPKALSVARSRFDYIYTGLRGNNSGGIPPWAIRRDAILAKDSLSRVGLLLEGAADRRYTSDINVYESWGM
jgi:peptidoglycan/xylan/chitin deacetylase (PgdA/CDA1 family)